jgi:hypothetical protein
MNEREQLALVEYAEKLNDFMFDVVTDVKNNFGDEDDAAWQTIKYYGEETEDGRGSWRDRIKNILRGLQANEGDARTLEEDLDRLRDHINEHIKNTVNPALVAKGKEPLVISFDKLITPPAPQFMQVGTAEAPPSISDEYRFEDPYLLDKQVNDILYHGPVDEDKQLVVVPPNSRALVSQPARGGVEMDTPETYRERSETAEANRRALDEIKLAVYANMGLVPGISSGGGAATIRTGVARLTNAQLADEIRQVENKKLSGSQRREFNKQFAEAVTTAGDFMLMPPRALIDAYNKADNDAVRNAVLERMGQLADEAASAGVDLFNFADFTNAGQTAEGYIEMANFLDSHGKGSANVNAARGKAEEYIKDWDKRHGFIDAAGNETVKPGKANEKKLNDRAKELEATLGSLSATPAMEALLNNISFTGATAGTAVPPAHADMARAHLLEVAKGELFNEALFKSGATDAASLTPMLEDKLKEVIWRTEVASKVGQGWLERPDLFTDPKFMSDYITKLGVGKQDMSISAVGDMEDFHLQESLNVIERTGTKLKNPRADVLRTMYFANGRAAQLDLNKGNDWRDRFTDRTAKTYNRNFMKQLGMSALSSGALGFSFNLIRHINFPVPGVGMVAVGAISSVLAIANVKRHYDQWKISQAEKGEKAGFLNYLKKPANLAHVGIAAASVGAAITGVGAAGSLANAVLRGAVLGGVALKGLIGGISRIGAAVKDAKENGKSVPLAVLGATGQAIAAGAVPILAGIAGGALANGLVAGINANTDWNIFKHKESGVDIKGGELVKTREATEEFGRSYNEETIKFAEMRVGSDKNLDVNGSMFAPGKTFNAETGTIADYDAAQYPGNFTTQSWISPQDAATITKNLGQSALFDPANNEIGGWVPDAGNETVMLSKMLATERLMGPNFQIDVGGDKVGIHSFIEGLKSAPPSPEQAKTIFGLQFDVSERNHWRPEMPGLSNTDSFTNTLVKGVMSYDTTRDHGVRQWSISVPERWDPSPTYEVPWEKWVPNEVPNDFVNNLPLALPFVFPARKVVKEFKAGVKALFDKTKKFIGGKIIGGPDEKPAEHRLEATPDRKSPAPSGVLEPTPSAVEEPKPRSRIVVPPGASDEREELRTFNKPMPVGARVENHDKGVKRNFTVNDMVDAQRKQKLERGAA